jgi:hypothetical protein
MIASGDRSALLYLHSRLPEVTMLFSMGWPVDGITTANLAILRALG